MYTDQQEESQKLETAGNSYNTILSCVQNIIQAFGTISKILFTSAQKILAITLLVSLITSAFY